MYRVVIHHHIERIYSVFYGLGIWQQEDKETVGGRRIKLFYAIYYCLAPISFITGAMTSGNQDESVFLIEALLITCVSVVRLFYMLWRKREVLELLNQICNYSVKDQNTFILINNKMKYLRNFVVAFVSSAFCVGIYSTLLVPFLVSERKLFFSIGFPLDWRNDELAYWLAVAFLFTEVIIMSISWLFTAIIWYLMANCGLRYVVFGQQLKNMGKVSAVDGTTGKRITSITKRDNIYRRYLLEAIKSHEYLNEYYCWK